MKMNFIFLFVILFHFTALTCGENGHVKSKVEPNVNLVVVITSQSNSYHAKKAVKLKESLLEQATDDNLNLSEVVLLHEWSNHLGAWTILPILSSLQESYPVGGLGAYVFVDDNVVISLHQLSKKLTKFDLSKDLFLGRALRDHEATIIHHFAHYEDPESFEYPDFASGFILSSAAVKIIVTTMKSRPPLSEFTIDTQHEFAMYLAEQGIFLQEVDFLCGYPEKPKKKCAVTIESRLPICGDPVDSKKIIFAVKTCKKYHKDRVSVIKKTWEKDARNILYFSDEEDKDIPTITLGIPNTERGHCAKCMALLRYIQERQNITGYDWIAVVDDDTLMSVSRLQKLLSCYNSSEVVALGERYGYAVSRDGYNYLTLGGGMLLSRAALEVVLDESCRCSSDDAPDDMTLGMCMKRLDVTLTHSPLFHQARPVDYSPEYLSNQLAVSFHRYWMVDPLQIYKKWLMDYVPNEPHSTISHSEL